MIDIHRLWQRWSRAYWLGTCCLFLGIGSSSNASDFGYSININFSASQQPIRGEAGQFGDTVWNNFSTPSQQIGQPLLIDGFDKPANSRATISWESPGFARTGKITATRPGDRELMSGYLQSPSKINLRNLNLAVPPNEDPITAHLLLYTFGEREGQVGTYRVGNQVQTRVDTSAFEEFEIGKNVLLFRNIDLSNLDILTDGFAPLNAMSLVYCRSGDFNNDGKIDVDDLNSLSEAVKHGPAKNSWDVNFDSKLDYNDIMSWIKCSKGTCVGDVNLDGIFDSTDLVILFQSGLYETGQDATWVQGDWNGDCRFDSADLLLAFQEGCYEGDRAFARGSTTTVAVPEPTTAGVGLLVLWGLLPAWRRRLRPSSRSDLRMDA